MADVDLQQGKVDLLIGQQNVGGKFAAVIQHHRDLVAVLDDMVVGDDQPIGPQDDAGAERVLHPLLRHAKVEARPEELLEERVVQEGRLRLILHHAPGVDIDDRWRHLPHDGRKAIGDFGPRTGHALGECSRRADKRHRQKHESNGSQMPHLDRERPP